MRYKYTWKAARPCPRGRCTAPPPPRGVSGDEDFFAAIAADPTIAPRTERPGSRSRRSPRRPLSRWDGVWQPARECRDGLPAGSGIIAVAALLARAAVATGIDAVPLSPGDSLLYGAQGCTTPRSE